MKIADELRRTVALSLVEDMGPVKFRNLLEAFGGLSGVFKADAKALAAVRGIPRPVAEALKEPSLFEKAESEIQKALKNGAQIVSYLDEAYPEELRTIYDPPILFYMRGKLPPRQQAKIAVVGSRKASAYGRSVTAAIAGGLAASGVVVVSGMARGIDTAAHEGALDAGGLTVAVLGGGLSKIYPVENRALAERIAAHGAVISEYPMDWPPKPEFFPVRNRIISGLSRAVLVAEADEKSGALITADAALEQGRDVFAVPGNVDSAGSRGTNALLKQGAKCVTSADDILQELGMISKETGSFADAEAFSEAGLGEEEKKVFSLVERHPLHVDDLIEKSRMPAGSAVATLSLLEIKGLVKQLPGKHFVRGDR